MADVLQRDVHYAILEMDIRGGRWRCRLEFWWLGDGIPAPNRLDSRSCEASGEVCNRCHELCCSWAVGDGMAKSEADHKSTASELRHLDYWIVVLDN